MKNQIYDLVLRASKNLNLPEAEFAVEYPADFKFGDYSANIALSLSKLAKVSPHELAHKIKNEIEKNLPDTIEKIEVAGPGFLNFYLSKTFFQNMIQQANELDFKFGHNEKLSGKSILVDYTDPNPFKQFHIGHLMSNTIGEFISRIYEASGAKLYRYTFQGDVGMHVAKTIWGIKKMGDAFPYDTDSLHDKLNFLGKAYAYGSNQFEDDQTSQAEIKDLNKKIYELYDDSKVVDDLDLKVYYEKGRKWSLEHFDEIYATLGSKFDRNIFESEIFKIGEKTVRENVPNVFELSDGAIVYKGEKVGLHTRVFINSQGLPTYEAKDIGLAFFKNTLVENYNASIVITASEQTDYFRVVKSALKELDEEIGIKTIHIGHGMMRFTDGKMSSRKGNIITGDSLITDIENLVDEKIKDRNFSPDQGKKVKEVIAVGAIKYSILRQATNKDIIFDFEKAISFEGDSGPYLQYTYTRAKSVLEKAHEAGIKIAEGSRPIEWQTTTLEKMISRFPEVIEKTLSELSPQNLVTYLSLLAGEFNSFYAETKILDDSQSVAYKLNLTRSVLITLRNGLQILGIKVPERM